MGRYGSSLASTHVSSRFSASLATAAASSGSPGKSYGTWRIPRGSSPEVNLPVRRSCAVITCSKVTSQCVSITTTVSGRSRSSTSLLIRRRPVTSAISFPSLISSRTSSGSMIVGTWETSPAPTTSPIPSLLPAGLVRRPRCRAHGLHVGMEVEAVPSALSPDPGVPRAAERGPQVTNEEAVHPHGPGDQGRRDAFGSLRISGIDDGRQAVVRVVGERDRFVLVRERLKGEDGAEHLVSQDLGAGWCVDEQRRPVVEAAELLVRPAAQDRLRSVLLCPADEPVHPLEVLPGDQGADGGVVPARIPLDEGCGPVDEAIEELVVYIAFDQQPGPRQADLAGVVVLVHRLRHRRVEVRVGKDQEGRL